MTILTTQRLIGILQAAPDGLTTKEVHALVPDAKEVTVSSRLGKLAIWGKIDRQYHHTNGGEHRRWCVWRARTE